MNFNEQVRLFTMDHVAEKKPKKKRRRIPRKRYSKEKRKDGAT